MMCTGNNLNQLKKLKRIKFPILLIIYHFKLKVLKFNKSKLEHMYLIISKKSMN